MTIVDSTSFLLTARNDGRTHRNDPASEHEFSNYDSAIQPEYANNFRILLFAGKRNRRFPADLRQACFLLRIARTLRTSIPANFPLRDDLRPHGRRHEES
ncbi:hypothetical protein [Shinella sp.]|uniref:hypothetical protein n=1 Tax=Shinella sp. TaxID=1870904 RepID=UPI00301E496A